MLGYGVSSYVLSYCDHLAHGESSCIAAYNKERASKAYELLTLGLPRDHSGESRAIIVAAYSC